MNKMSKGVCVLLTLLVILPGTALCKKKTSSYEDDSYNPYYDMLAQSGGAMPLPAGPEPVVPSSMAGKKAIGYGGNPGLYDGLSVKYWITDGMGINVNGSIVLDSIGGDTAFTLNLRPKFLLNFSRSDTLLVNLFGGIDFLLDSNIDHLGSSEYNFVYAFGGIAPELFIAENFSIETSFGVYIDLVGSEGGSSTFGIGTFGEALTLTSINFHVYF